MNGSFSFSKELLASAIATAGVVQAFNVQAQQPDTLEEVYEPFLIMEGFITD